MSPEHLAESARRTAVLESIRARPNMTLAELDVISRGQYAEQVESLTVGELMRPETNEDRVLRVFRQQPGARLSSQHIGRVLGLKRWVAQGLLADMAVRGLVVRTGVGSSTRYGLPNLAERLSCAS